METFLPKVLSNFIQDQNKFSSRSKFYTSSRSIILDQYKIFFVSPGPNVQLPPGPSSRTNKRFLQVQNINLIMVLEDGPRGSLKFEFGGILILVLEDEPGRSLKSGPVGNLILVLEDGPVENFILVLKDGPGGNLILVLRMDLKKLSEYQKLFSLRNYFLTPVKVGLTSQREVA